MPHLENRRCGKVWQVGRLDTPETCPTTSPPCKGERGVASGAGSVSGLEVRWGK